MVLEQNRRPFNNRSAKQIAILHGSDCNEFCALRPESPQDATAPTYRSFSAGLVPISHQIHATVHVINWLQEALQGSSPATAEESTQLLWLAEAEHLLGAAYLQKAFGALEKVRRPHRPPAGEQSPAPAASEEASMDRDSQASPAGAEFEASDADSTGTTRPWGYTSGPFAQVVAAMLVDAPSPDGMGVDDEECGVEEGEEGPAIAKLEVRGAGGVDIPLTLAASRGGPLCLGPSRCTEIVCTESPGLVSRAAKINT